MKNILINMLMLFVALDLISAQAATQAGVQAVPDKEVVTLYVTRHGKTLFNTVHRAQGWSDTPLTTSGVTVAEELGRGLKVIPFIAAYSSDSGRARQTAKIALAYADQAIPVYEDERLREAFFGSYEGELDSVMWKPVAEKLGFADALALLPALSKGQITLGNMMDALAFIDPSHTAETASQVKVRMQAAIYDIANKTRAEGGGNVLIVSHGMSILTMLDGMVKPEDLRTPLENASVTVVTYKDGKFTVGAVGDMQFLEKGKFRK